MWFPIRNIPGAVGAVDPSVLGDDGAGEDNPRKASTERGPRLVVRLTNTRGLGDDTNVTQHWPTVASPAEPLGGRPGVETPALEAPRRQRREQFVGADHKYPQIKEPEEWVRS